MRRLQGLLFTVAVLLSVQVSAKQQLIYAGQLLAVPGQPVLQEQSLLVEDDTIVWIKPGYVVVDGVDEVIDLKDAFVLPGLMDMHVHIQQELGPENDSEILRMSQELIGMRSIWFAQKTLAAGFTTVRDLGSHEETLYALRDAINNGWVEGPRIIAAGVVGITGGHGDISGVNHELLTLFTEDTVCDGPFDCRRAARQVIKYGGDWIKITATGGVLTDRDTGTGLQMATDELSEVVSAARSMGKKVAAHAHQEDGIIAALEAGVASIEHGSYTGKKAIKLFKQTGAYLVPTLLAGATVVRMAEESDFLSPAIKEKALRVGADMQSSFAKAHKAGVKIAYGTDSGVSRHGTNAEEAVLMVQAGMTPSEVIQSATINAADLLGMSDQIGRLAPGMQADIIATHSSPLEDIESLLSVAFVMKSGIVFKSQ